MSKTDPVTQREKYLAEALRHMILMHVAMMEETPVETIPYSRATRNEMGQALIHAESALRMVGYTGLSEPASEQDQQSLEAMLLASTDISGKPN